ncbi:MAG TPA: hypothetical protein VG406_24345 [Isosphaeraceae bacterium]|jgi:uncharacterized repeat protein (TIGR01451 family)|nr:hypothetical protein [Isosphaeraceae bacterium]
MVMTPTNRRGAAARLALALVLTTPIVARAQATNPPGIASTAPAEAPAASSAPTLPPDVQLVKFRVPEGVALELLGPATEPLPTGVAPDLIAMKVGVAYHLKLSKFAERPDAVLYPVVEVVGHLHRPSGIDPSKFPIRVPFRDSDILDAIDRNRMVSEVIYLEDPEQALPMALPKGEIPVATLTAGENPLKVAAKLGRVMAMVTLGGRAPTADEIATVSGSGLTSGPCPFVGPSGPCGLPCGPVTGTPPPPGRPWLPKDEFICDGGDRDTPLQFIGDGGLRGIDPRDALIVFNDGRRPRVLPTNMVCIYAPRFAAVLVSLAAVGNVTVQGPRGAEILERQQTTALRQPTLKFVRNETLVLARHRMRPSNLQNRAIAGGVAELRVLDGLVGGVRATAIKTPVGAETLKNRRKAMGIKTLAKPVGIKTAESAVVTGLVQGPMQTVMTWPAREVAGSETPPNLPGLAVIKRVSTGVAEPGDVITYSIQYRNMGNTPISSVSIIDSLTARLEYVPRSAKGPAGTVFTAGENKSGGTELRWDLPGALAPGAEGYVTFEALVR